MRTSIIALMLTLLSIANTHAQSQGAMDKAAADNRSCLLMSDSMSTALGLSEEQATRVRKSDERCLQACEKVGYRTTGAVDEAAMREHEAELKEILSAEQYTTWSGMCMATGAMPKPAPTTPHLPSEQ